VNNSTVDRCGKLTGLPNTKFKTNKQRTEDLPRVGEPSKVKTVERRGATDWSLSDPRSSPWQRFRQQRRKQVKTLVDMCWTGELCNGLVLGDDTLLSCDSHAHCPHMRFSQRCSLHLLFFIQVLRMDRKQC
jgi:hypothetical protein